MLAILIDMFGAITFPTWIKDEAFSLGPLSVKWYGISYIIGIYGAYFYAASLAKRRDVWIANGATRKPELVPNKVMLQDLLFYCFIGIIADGFEEVLIQLRDSEDVAHHNAAPRAKFNELDCFWLT